MIQLLIRFYKQGTYTIEQFKTVIVKYNLVADFKTNYNIVQVVETEDIRFEKNGYVLEQGEKFLNEDEFFLL